MDTRCSSTIWDCSNFLAANSRFFAMAWAVGGGGKVAVLPHDKPGKMPSNPPGVVGHTAPVLDWQWHPFNEMLLATASEDTTVRIWSIPETGLTENMETAVQTLEVCHFSLPQVPSPSSHPGSPARDGSSPADLRAKLRLTSHGISVIYGEF